MAITVQQLKSLVNTGKRYTINDEKGLQLEVMASGNKFWRFRYWIDKKEYKLTIGSYPEIGLSDAIKYEF